MNNQKCPCGSNQKYKNCCMIYHNGVKATNALLLMKSRYSAYAVCNAKYIIKTTHPNNGQYVKDEKKWSDEIIGFCKTTKFLGLSILEFIDGEQEAYVTFKAKLGGGDMIEKSRFVKQNGTWLYESGTVEIL